MVSEIVQVLCRPIGKSGWRRLGVILAAACMVVAPSGRSMAQSDVPARSDFEVIDDVAYGPSPSQRMDIYLPPDLQNAPALLMVHGGAWMVGDKATADVVANKARHWLAKGYVFISVNTRLVPEADPIEQAEDVARALAAAQSMSGVWGGDPDRFALIGHSSGGHVVALLAADPEITTAQDARPWLGTIVLDSGGFDMPEIMGRRHMDFYDQAFGADPDFWRAASPTHRMAVAPDPMLLVCSSLSKTSCPQAQTFAEAVAETGGRATVLPVALSHMALSNDLGLPGSYTGAVDSFLEELSLP